MIFHNRKQTGLLLAERLQSIPMRDPLILALPRGGVPVAFELAHALGAPLEVLVVRKIGAPDHEEYGIGAVTEDQHYWIDPQAKQYFGAQALEIDRIVAREKKEVERRIQLYRQKRSLPNLRGRSLLVVDDGLATGVTARVACAHLRQQKAAEVILAVPVCSPGTAAVVRAEVDQLICLHEPENFSSVGQFYREFEQVPDHVVIELLEKARGEQKSSVTTKEIEIRQGVLSLGGTLAVPPAPKGIVIFAHGSGSSRFSPRNRAVAEGLQRRGLATLLFDLLTPAESESQKNVFDVPLLAERLILATNWIWRQEKLDLPVGYFGASTGAGAALWAAAELDGAVSAVVSRGGRPDLARAQLKEVTAPTLLLVGGLDHPVVSLNEEALRQLRNAQLTIVPGATHLFEETGTLERVQEEAARWFLSAFAKGAQRATA